MKRKHSTPPASPASKLATAEPIPSERIQRWHDGSELPPVSAIARKRERQQHEQRRRQFSSVIRNRITIYSVIITGSILVILGASIGSAGLAHVRSSEREAAVSYFTTVRTNLTAWAKAETSPTLQRALYEILRGETPVAATTLMGFVDGKLITYQGDPDMQVMQDPELLQAIQEKQAEDAITFNVKTKRGQYAIAILPIRWGPQTGAFVVVQDDDELAESAYIFIRVYAGVSMLALVALAIVTFLTTSRMLAPLLRLRNLSRTISETDLTQRLPVDDDDDLAELAMSFNGMVDRLQIAFNAQRDLLNDAGHELRTPITVVRGHLELMDPTDPDEVVHTRELALDELSRMHRLAEDLMTVATFDRPDFVTKNTVDVADLTLETYEHASTLGPRQWDIASISNCVIKADQQRLSQAWLQLANNAVKFSATGTQIDIGSQVDGVLTLVAENGNQIVMDPVSPYDLPEGDHALLLWVRDRGIGIEPMDQERIFERFVRVSHERPGSGLGLSIVQAIAAAHGGRLEVASQPGVGTIFAIRIPVTTAELPEIEEDEDVA